MSEIDQAEHMKQSRAGGKIRPLIAGNWKMHGLSASLQEITAVRDGISQFAGDCDVLLCLPATLLAAASSLCAGTALAIGAQDCHSEPAGAFTGDLSASQLKDAGASYCILGHSERRAIHRESDALIHAKVLAALSAGLTPIICVGESETERDAGETLAVIGRQVLGSVPPELATPFVLAYEPVWAIGTGRTPREDDIIAVHQFLRKTLYEHSGAAAATTPLLYGGSVKPENAAAILALPEVNGALVGGASLKANDFLAIVSAGARV